MEKIFVDPLVYSARLLRVNLIAFGGVLLLLLAAAWTIWLLGSRAPSTFRLLLMVSSMVAAAAGAGYYMMKRTQQAWRERSGFTVSETGFRSETPAGVVEASWAEVLEVRIGLLASRSRNPDVLIKTRNGYVSAFMRWVDRAGEMPEPRLLSGGRILVYPGGREVRVTPANSQLVQTLRERVAAERIREGVIISL